MTTPKQGPDKSDTSSTDPKPSSTSPQFKRSNKRAPREVSSKRKVSVIRELKSGKQSTRDPRFDDLSGTFDENVFEASYGFIKEMRSGEKSQLQAELKKCKDPRKRDQLIKLINKMNTSEKAQQVKTERQKLKVQSRKRAMDNVKQGKNPYFAKKSELRKSELKNKFEKLKKEGKVDKYMAKRRKQNLQKDKKSL